jgi:hypothetical protein
VLAGGRFAADRGHGASGRCDGIVSIWKRLNDALGAHDKASGQAMLALHWPTTKPA